MPFSLTKIKSWTSGGDGLFSTLEDKVLIPREDMNNKNMNNKKDILSLGSLPIDLNGNLFGLVTGLSNYVCALESVRNYDLHKKLVEKSLGV